jgi:Spy/CpxP family protein refolding chaperone
MLRVRTVIMVAVALAAGGFFVGRMLVAQDRTESGRRLFREGGNNFGLTKTALLKNSDVQKEIHLTDDQKTTLQKFSEDMHTEVLNLLSSLKGLHDMSQDDRRAKLAEVVPKLEDDEKAIHTKFQEVLSSDQQQRLDQIELQAELQREPSRVYLKQEVVDNLQYTDDQHQKLEEIRKNARSRGGPGGPFGFGGPGGPGGGGPGGPGGPNGAGRNGGPGGGQDSATRKKNNEETLTKIKEVLTPEQRDKFDKMLGPTFEGDLSEITGIMGGGGRGRGNRRGRGGRNGNASQSTANSSATKPSTTTPSSSNNSTAKPADNSGTANQSK